MKSKNKIIELARAYLRGENVSCRETWREELDAYRGDADAIMDALRPQPPPRARTGWTLARDFEMPGRQNRYPEQPFTLYVPEDYDVTQPRGLLIWLHGGGQGRGDCSVHLHEKNPWLNPVVESSGRIVCYPSAPPSDRCWARWQLPEADAYIEDLIEELSAQYAIDPDDVLLGGHSMGGMGAYHMAHRFADRFTSVLASAGHWDFAVWRALMGTSFWISNGINDAILFRRRHGTDIAFARLARRRLEESGVEFHYREHSGSHHLGDAIWVVREWLEANRGRRRDPHAPHVVAVTPRGLSPWSEWRRHKVPLAAHENSTDFHSIPPAPHARWVSIDEIGTETIQMDMLTMTPVRDHVEQDWNDFSLHLKRKHVPGAVVEARRAADGSIDVMPRNAAQVTLWLHPDVMDLNDVRIRVRGIEVFRGQVTSRLSTRLDAYLRRKDWGLIYPARITLKDDGTWPSGDQLKIDPSCRQ